MDPITIAALASAGGSVAGNLLNSFSQRNQNQQSQAWSLDMYNRQKADSLAFWDKQNDYNSPANQMKRFQEAGLNPNMVYGAGNPGNAGAVPTPDVATPQFRSPEWGNAVSGAGLNALNAIYDLEIKQAQVDNLKASNNVILEEAGLKAAQRKSLLTGEENTRFGLDFKRDLRDVSADYQRERLRQTRTATDLSINEDARRAVANSSSVKEAAERILNLQESRLNMRQQRIHSQADVLRIADERRRIKQHVLNMQKTGALQDLDLELRKNNIFPHDPMWARFVSKFLTGPSLFQGLNDEWNDHYTPAKEPGWWNWLTKSSFH